MRERPSKKLKLDISPVSTGEFAKIVEDEPLSDIPQSALFRAAKTLGVVTDSIPVSVNRQGTEHFVTASAGNSFLVYDVEHMHVAYMSPPLHGNISCLLSVGDGAITAIGNDIQIWNKMIQVASLQAHKAPITMLETLGGVYLLSVDENATAIVWELPNLTRDTKPLSTPLLPSVTLAVGFQVTRAVSIPTYVNKMLLGGANGELELWNVRTGKKVFAFDKQPACITAICPSPALDVAAVGRSDGHVVVMNLKSAEILFELDQSEQGEVTSLSFRGDSVPMLVAGSSSGAIVLWDISKRRVHSVIDSAHRGRMTRVHCLDNLPLMLTSAADNSISVWIFDKADGGCRLLRSRQGMTGAIQHMNVYGDNEVLVASEMSVGKVSLIQNQQNQIWSQSNLHKMTSGENSKAPWRYRPLKELPSVTLMAFSKLRHFDWPSVITCHAGLPDAYVWSSHQAALVNRMLIVPNNKSEASAVAVSACGNYAVLGLDDGSLHKFNLQSCLYRGIVGRMNGRIRDIAYLANCREIIAADATSIIKYRVAPSPVLVAEYESLTGKFIGKITVSGLFCAVALRTGGVSIIDVSTDREVRRVATATPVTSLCWSCDGKWLVIATSDANLVVYDFPGDFIRDRICFVSPAISCTFAKDDAFLLTTHPHTARLGAVHAWQNLSLIDTNRPTAPAEPVQLDGLAKAAEETDEAPVSVVELQGLAKVYTPLGNSSVMTLSDIPITQLQTLLMLDEIKERNTFAKAVRKPKAVPFFLPTVTDNGKTFFAPPVETEAAAASVDLVPARERAKAASIVARAEELTEARQWDDLFAHLKAQTASGVYLCLSELGGRLIPRALEFFTSQVKSGYHADLVQTWLGVYLKLHGEDLLGVEGVSAVAAAVCERDKKLSTMISKVLCFSKVLSSVQLLS